VRPFFVSWFIVILANESAKFLFRDFKRPIWFLVANGANDADFIRNWFEACKAAVDVFLHVADNHAQ
jgi:hypothetical protein